MISSSERYYKCVYLTASLVLLCAQAVFAQKLGPKNEPAAMGSNYQPLLWQGADAQFAQDTARANMCQAAADQLAGSRSSDSDVQEAAAHSISFEDRSEKWLKSTSRAIGFKLISKKYPPECADAVRLKALSGDEFDREYAKVLAENSRDAQARYTAEARAAPNSANYELRKFAVRQLAEVQRRQPSIEAIAKRYDSPQSD